ncbi:hypothetical protein Tco_0954247 [Tanacetum coccineum]|uniref:Uncharacterized protein n=1 Tax=Tanacetum coccineum TaxID=301880 RepID=A0ABQ5E2X7_9ASTR
MEWVYFSFGNAVVGGAAFGLWGFGEGEEWCCSANGVRMGTFEDQGVLYRMISSSDGNGWSVCCELAAHHHILRMRSAGGAFGVVCGGGGIGLGSSNGRGFVAR